jgi:dihydrofolate reductase
MRKVIYGGACSLDGFLSGPGGTMDWLHFSKDVEAVMARSWATADTILFGRKTWERAAAEGGGGALMPGTRI